MANKWTKEQQLAIDLRGHRILVSAAAGSGKTAVLTERIAGRLCDVNDPVDADQLLVMTFTRAAAGEMKERIRRRLIQMQQEPDLSSEQRSRLGEQSALLDSAYITTIDSFCGRVVREHPDEAEVDPSFRVVDTMEKTLLQQDMLEEMLEEYYEKADPDFLGFVGAYTKAKTSDDLNRMILEVYEAAQNAADPKEWYAAQIRGDNGAYRTYMLEQAKVLLEAALEQAQEALEICLEADGPAGSVPYVSTDIDDIESALKAQDFDELRERLAGIEFPELSRARKGVDHGKKTELTRIRNSYKEMLRKSLIGPLCTNIPNDYEKHERGAAGAIGVLVSLARDFDERYTARKREKNVMEFSDVAYTALRLLKMEDIGGEYRGRFREIYIDEYQDSSDIQEGLKDAIDTGEVFMVGDVKQSIYGFRNARPELFMKKYDSFEPAGADISDDADIRIDLSSNFRSRASVLDGINRIFRTIMMRDLGGVEYTPEAELHAGAEYPVPGEGVRTGGRTQLLILDKAAGDIADTDERDAEQDGAAADPTVLEARMVARKIHSLMSGPESIIVREGDGYRPLRYADIAILYRSGANAQTYQSVLMDSGIPAYIDSRKGYFDTQEVRTMLAVLGAVNNPLRDIEMTAWMCSPMIDMTQEEIARLMAVYKRRRRKDGLRCVKRALELAAELLPETEDATDVRKTVKESPEVQRTTGHENDTHSMTDVCSDEEAQAVRQDSLMTASIRSKAALALKKLADYDEKSRSMPISELIAYICSDTGYYDYVSALPGGSVRRANLERLMELARNYARTGYQGLFNFVRYVETVRTYNEDMGEANVLGENDDIVRIMTIHKSKGMEFPVCILAEAGHGFNRDNKGMLIDYDLGIACAYIDPELHVKYPTLKQQAVRFKQKNEQLGEELRVLYVALTRAKEQLIITAGVNGYKRAAKKCAGMQGITGVRSAGCYLDWLLMDPEGYDLDVRLYRPSDLPGDMQKSAKKQALDEWIDKLVLTPEAKARYDGIFDFVYPYQADTTLHNKVSISELKRLGQHEDDEQTYVPEYAAGDAETAETAETVKAEMAFAVGETDGHSETSCGEDAAVSDVISDKQPARPTGKSSYAGAQRGSVYHRVFEKLDFSRATDMASMKVYLDELLPDTEERRMVKSRDILCWAESDIGRAAADADAQGRFFREREFIMGLPARELGIADSDEPVLIQGIIDAYIEDDDAITLIDYKTDRVKTGEELKERYRIQLKYYATALEKMKHKPVKRQLIWSVQLGEAVEL